MANNSTLNKARYELMSDEFYTPYELIEKELKHYSSQLKNKVVLCNCDYPLDSNFAMYFIKNFKSLSLKKLVCTAYTAPGKAEFDKTGAVKRPISREHGWVLELETVPDWIIESTDKIDICDWLIREKLIKRLNDDGDFLGPECLSYLMKSDFVITNPPFSKFREIVSMIIKFQKKFLLIGNANALTYKEIFPLLRDNKAWIGHGFGDMYFRVPQESQPRSTRFWIDDQGQKWRSLGNAMWLTNIDIEKRHIPLELEKEYDPEVYPKYDDFDAIEVSRVAEIPKNYFGIMGVPITFLNKHDPDQFDIVGEANHGSDNSYDLFRPTINGKLKFKRILIRRKVDD